MRNLPPRPVLDAKGTAYLTGKTGLIVAAANPKVRAEAIYAGARQTKLFLNKIVAALRTMSGIGERCMFCGSSEASQVDHFKPKAVFPESAMLWENFVWICGVCNLNKGDRYPKHTDQTPLLINPIDEDVWRFFELDRFGLMVPLWDVQRDDLNLRGQTTEEIIGLNRQAIQEARHLRLKELEANVNDCILLHTHGHLPMLEKNRRMQAWFDFPFHPEVAQYFLRGPGARDEPFATFLRLQ